MVILRRETLIQPTIVQIGILDVLLIHYLLMEIGIYFEIIVKYTKGMRETSN